MPIKSLIRMDNYRDDMDKTRLKELAESIKHKGVLQPILVRPKDNAHQIVAGNRRYLAADMAGLVEIPTIIKTLTDEEALEIQVIENGQREDTNPMDDARGFQKLIDTGKHTPKTLAERLGKTLAHVNTRLKLLELPKEAQKAVQDEKITIGHAMVLMRLKNPADQKEFLEEMKRDGGMTVQAAIDRCQRYSLNIEQAAFDTTDCKTCPYLASNQTLLFAELKKSGQCTGRHCYMAKTKKHYEAQIAEKRKAGFPIITDQDEIRNAMSYGARKTCVILAPDTTGHHNAIRPKRYKSDCIKCTEHHAYFFHMREFYGGIETIYGEICLNKKCLDKMNTAPKAKTQEALDANEPETIEVNENESTPSRREKARFCRDRFLRANIPAKVEASATLQKRLAIYHLLCRFGIHNNTGEILKKYAPSASASYRREQAIYHVVMQIETEKLDAVMAQLATDLVQITDPKVLLMLAPEATIDMTTDFGPDEEFLKCMKKNELVEYATAAELGADLQGDDKKGDMLKKLTVLDLRGKLTESLRQAIKVEDMTAANKKVEEENFDPDETGDDEPTDK